MIGVFGGSFDPVHYGHLHNARAIKQELGLDKLLLVPCKTPVHKQGLHFSTEQRLHMLALAVQTFSDLSIDTQEISRQAPSYTIDTLKQIKQKYPQKKIFFIMGSDSFISLHTWKDYQQLSQYAQLVVLPRKGDKVQSDTTVYFAKTPLVDISSTQIRSKIDNHQNLSNNLSGLMPDSIIHYINQL